MWFGDLVTMRWWDDLWLNESFAEYASHLATAEATRLDAGLDDLLLAGEVLGVPPGPAALDPPDRRRHPRPRGRRGQLRRHHLRQGRLGAQAARRVGGPRGVLRRRPAPTSPGTPGATPSSRDLLAELEATCGRDLAAWSELWLEQAGVTLLRPEIETDARRDDHLLRRPPGGPGRAPDAAPAPSRRRRVRRRRGRRRRLERGCASSSTSTAPGPTVPELVGAAAPGPAPGQRRRPRLRQGAPGRGVAGLGAANLGAFTDSLPRALVLGLRVGHDPRRRVAGAASSSTWCCGTSRTRRTPRWCSVLLRQLATAVEPYVARRSTRRDARGAAWRTGCRHWPAAPRRRRHPAAAGQGAGPARRHGGRSSTSVAGLARRPARRSTASSVDTDLRWDLLHGARGRGPRGRRPIAAELGRDATATGERAAARARGPRSRPQRPRRGVARRRGLRRPAPTPCRLDDRRVRPGARPRPARAVRRAVLRGPRDGVERTRTNEMAQNIVVGLYPHSSGAHREHGVDVVA